MRVEGYTETPGPKEVTSNAYSSSRPGRDACRCGSARRNFGACADGRADAASRRDLRTDARGVCFDIDPERIKEANENVAKNNVGNLVRVVHADLFEQDLSGASVVTLYLLPSLNVKLMP